MPHYIFRVARPLPEAFSWLPGTGLGIQPMLWTIEDGPHPVPYDFETEKAAATTNQRVTVYDGTPYEQKAIRVGTNCWASCVHGKYLVSDSYGPCVPVIGLSRTRTFLGHLNNWISRDLLFDAWDMSCQVMILRKTGPAQHVAIIEPLRAHLNARFTGGAFIQDLQWNVNVAVIVHRSTCIAYRQA